MCCKSISNMQYLFKPGPLTPFLLDCQIKKKTNPKDQPTQQLPSGVNQDYTYFLSAQQKLFFLCSCIILVITLYVTRDEKGLKLLFLCFRSTPVVKNASSWAHSRNWLPNLRARVERRRTVFSQVPREFLSTARMDCGSCWEPVLGSLPPRPGLARARSFPLRRLSPPVLSVASPRATSVQPLLRLQPCGPAQPSGQSPDGQAPAEDWGTAQKHNSSPHGPRK